MGHTCAIPTCTQTAKDGELMCWPHWNRVPRALNRAIFETCHSGPRAAYRANVAEAVRIVEEKQSLDAARPGSRADG